MQGRTSEDENSSHMLPFTGEDLDRVLSSMKVDTAPGPDGWPVMFFKRLWVIVKLYILAIQNDFALGRVDVARLNFRILTLIRKVKRDDDIRQFRPIALISMSF